MNNLKSHFTVIIFVVAVCTPSMAQVNALNPVEIEGKPEDHSQIVIMIEVAVEYSWGQEIVLIKDKAVKYLGYLNYAAVGDEEESLAEESLAEYCRIQESKGKILLSFDDVSIIDYSDDDKIIDGKSLKLELSSAGIEKIIQPPNH